MRIVFFIILGLNILNAAFIKDGDTVLDNENNLEWQDNDSVYLLRKDWIEAIDYCEDLSLDGKQDWRLPNQNELLSILDYTTNNLPINSAFNSKGSGSYWSSTSALNNSRNAWATDFGLGKTTIEFKRMEYFVRCVRGGE